MGIIINKIKKEYLLEKNKGESHNIKDKTHTISELRYNQMLLFSMVINYTKLNKKAFKSKLNSDGTMQNGYFIVGVTTKCGMYSLYIKLKYWDKFKCQELNKAPAYDGHKPEDIGRLINELM